MSKPKILLVTVILLGVLGALLAASGAANLLRVPTGSVSHSLCDAAFVSGIDPDRVYAEEQRPEGGMSFIAWALHYQVDRAHRSVRTTVFGWFASRAVYRDGLGCLLLKGEDRQRSVETAARPRDSATQPMDTTVSRDATATPAPRLMVTVADPGVQKALDRAFAEPNPARPRWTKAVVVMHDGRIIAERYAQGYGPETRIWGHSLSKSVINALIGVQVRKGVLTTGQSVPVAIGQSAVSHRAVTIDELLRMTSGLPFDETTDVISPMNRMSFLERDMAGYAERMPLAYEPGVRWNYSNLAYLILSRILRDTAGAGAEGAQRFARRELFEPLGMQNALIESDATGTPIGANGVFASARDWTRFGQLYLDDGVADGVRILPEGWVKYSVSQTLDTGYGAGFWTNLVTQGNVPVWDAPWGMPELPKDMFFARGYLGQYIVIVPSEHLVVARLGLTHGGSTGVGRVVADIIAALHDRPAIGRTQ
jgi:CubicO group peptidase (beta-lactamase class C family)